MKNLLLLLMVLYCFGCAKKETEEITPCANVDAMIYLTYRNGNGQDLFDPTTPGHYRERELRLYYIHDGKTVEVNNPMMYMPRNLKLEAHTKIGYLLSVITNVPPLTTPLGKDEVVTGESTTLLQLNEATTDTIRTSWKRTKCTFKVVQIRYNGELMWDESIHHLKTELFIIKE
jgi:hypothetical protein